MAIEPTNIDPNIQRSIEELDDGMRVEAPPPVREEVYRLMPETKVPVSKFEGPVWQGRKKAAQKQLESLISAWDEAEYYYDNTQDSHRKETQGTQQGNRNYGKDRRDSFSMTENVVYATVNAVVPNTYAKNPNVEVTMNDPQLEKFGVMLETLLNKIASTHYAPGIHLKPKVKKSIVRCEIMNEAWIMVGWTKKEDSAEGAREDIARIGKEMVDAKDEATLTRLEGELMALEESIDLLDPAGPWIKTLQAKQVLVDTAAVEDDYSDANWMMVEVLLPTNYLNARFRIKQKDGSYTSAYKPTHVVDASQPSTGDGVQQEIDSFKMFDNSKDNANDYGYSDRRTYERAKRTKCFYAFDKIKRRYYLYADSDWTFPIWCFDDPYRLPTFFPLTRLTYHASPKATRTKGEVSYYLDQQDEINVIADELNRARVSLRDNTLFNSTVLTLKDVEDIVLNSNKKMKGVKVPEGQKLTDIIMGPPMPTLQYEHLWDKSRAMGAITQISGVMDAMRGEQFKTNTTNDAIANYNSISGVRLDEKRDAIEDFVGAIMYNIMFMWLQFGDQEMTLDMVGSSFAAEVQAWQPGMDPREIRRKVQCSVEGGSTQKPTSAAKKAEALQIGQILGQFASASPAVVLLLLKIFQRAFDGVVITDADWTELRQGIMMQMQRGASGEGGGEPQAESDDEAVVADMVKKGVPEQVAREKVAASKKQQQ